MHTIGCGDEWVAGEEVTRIRDPARYTDNMSQLLPAEHAACDSALKHLADGNKRTTL